MSLRTRIAEAIDIALLAATKRAKRIRTASEFNVPALIPTVRSPIVPSAAWTWDLAAIMDARDQQMLGQFAAPVELAKSMRTDDALFSAWANRLAPQRRLGIEMKPGRGPKANLALGEGEALFGEAGVAVTPDTLADINDAVANHGVAIGVNLWTPRPDGSRVDVEHQIWPLQYTWYNTAARCLMTRIDPFPQRDFANYDLPKDTYGSPPLNKSVLVPIIHGDGRWTIYQKHSFMPWQKDAALLAAALIWGAHAFSQRDWAKNSSSHGSSKVVGEMPEGVDLQEDSEKVQAFMALLLDIAASDNPYGIKPFGSKVDILSNPSQMHAIFKDLSDNREKAAHRVYCGTDAALGAQGGAPGVDVASLFGVSENIVSGDLTAIERGFLSGVIEPWAAINHGSSECAPRRCYAVPDSDAAQLSKQQGEAQTAYVAAITSIQSAGIQVTQQMCDDLAGQFRAKAIVLGADPLDPGNAHVLDGFAGRGRMHSLVGS